MTHPKPQTLTTQQAEAMALFLQGLATTEAAAPGAPFEAAYAAMQATLASLADLLQPGTYAHGQYVIERGQRATGDQWQCDGYQGISVYEPTTSGWGLRLVAAFWNVAAWQAATGNLGQVTRQTKAQAAA